MQNISGICKTKPFMTPPPPSTAAVDPQTVSWPFLLEVIVFSLTFFVYNIVLSSLWAINARFLECGI